MLREDIPGGRLLTLRRRRSRLPWIYAVYHAPRSNLRVTEGHVRATATPREARALASLAPVLQGEKGSDPSAH